MFQRARSEEQREARRQAILGAAAAMLAEMPVAEVTLNELSRRAGLAKSNVLRYFESREAVLLELLDSAWQDWLVQLDGDLAGRGRWPAAPARRARRPAGRRGGGLARGPADAVRPAQRPGRGAGAQRLAAGRRPVQAGQHRWHHRARRPACSGACPNSASTDAFRLAGATVLMTAALWPHTQPSAAMLAAYAADPALAAMRLDFAATLREVLEVLIAGLLARSSR